MKLQTLLAIAVLSWLPTETALTATVHSGKDKPAPAVSIIIDDMGEQLTENLRALRMRHALTYSILPGTTYGRYLSQLAHDLGHETMLHLPMQSVKGLALGHGGLTDDMNRKQFADTFRRDLADVPYISGINNHMGSLLTQDRHYMRWLMEEMLQAGNLYFVDSRTSAQSVAYSTAVSYAVPTMRRKVFLDNVVTTRAIRAQFQRLIAVARRDGTAIAIGHPNEATLAVLEAELPRLPALGIKLLPVSELIEYRKQIDADPHWHLARSETATVTSPINISASSLVTHNVVP